jgi:amino acid adenylation domain-containing protein
MIERLQDWVTAHATRRPSATAIADRGERITYEQLETLSTRLARALKDAGCRPGDRVSLLVPKSPIAIVAILGIYKADCLFVPLDAASPTARLARILDSCESRCILAAGPVVQRLNELLDHTSDRALAVGWLEPAPPADARFPIRFTLDDVQACSDAPLVYTHGATDPAHILFTSGSTGVPKGVVITHANVMHFVEWARKYFDMGPSDRVSCHSPLHFDLSTFDIFGAFAAGAELHLVPPDLNMLPNKLAEFIRERELTQWFSVPSMLNYLAKFDALRSPDFPHLKRVLWCGEVLPTPALIYWMRHVPHASFTNLYGPTEATIASSYYRVTECPRDAAAEIPIGAPCDGEELLVLNEQLVPVPPGEVGDLYLAGVGLSPGYWRDSERTAAAFVPDARGADPARRLYKTGDLAKVGEDGLVYFLGRADSQIKSRGYRIELGEIEAALTRIDGLQEVAVVGIPTGGFEGTLIACAYAPLGGRDVPPASVRASLTSEVPAYMLPSRWLVLPQLPKNASGKIDRRALRERFQADEARTA